MGLLRAMDVSSAQPRDLTALIRRFSIEHVIVKLYQTRENVSQQHTMDQVHSAWDNGCSAGGYLWLYRDLEVNRQVDDGLELAARLNLTLSALWKDIETYPEDGSIPGWDIVQAAIRETQGNGVQSGLYSSREMWQRIGDPPVPEDVSLWVADWNHIQTLDVAPFGGARPEQVWAHQYWADPIDMDVINEQGAGVAVPEEPARLSYEELQNRLGYLTGDIPQGLRSEASRKAGIRKSQINAIAKLCEDQRIS